VNFTGAGTCTVSLTVTDPNDPEDCITTCTQIVTVNPLPPCNIDGDLHACVGNTKTYTTSAGAEYTRTWSVTSTPAGICNIVGGNTGGTVQVNYTRACACTVSLTVTDPNDPTDCTTTCTQIVNVDPQPPCNIDGDLHASVGNTKTNTTSAGAQYTRTWSVTSTPAGI
jgi:mRNA-degrading endonuclease toxin of MazEF toxin-antitoxin module